MGWSGINTTVLQKYELFRNPISPQHPKLSDRATCALSWWLWDTQGQGGGPCCAQGLRLSSKEAPKTPISPTQSSAAFENIVCLIMGLCRSKSYTGFSPHCLQNGNFDQRDWISKLHLNHPRWMRIWKNKKASKELFNFFNFQDFQYPGTTSTNKWDESSVLCYARRQFL